MRLHACGILMYAPLPLAISYNVYTEAIDLRCEVPGTDVSAAMKFLCAGMSYGSLACLRLSRKVLTDDMQNRYVVTSDHFLVSKVNILSLQ